MGPELMENIRAQAERFGAELVPDDIVAVDLTGTVDSVTDGAGTVHRARAVIVATGSQHRKLNLHGQDALSGRGVSYSATCDGFFFREHDIVVVGGGDTAMEEATFLARCRCRGRPSGGSCWPWTSATGSPRTPRTPRPATTGCTPTSTGAAAARRISSCGAGRTPSSPPWHRPQKLPQKPTADIPRSATGLINPAVTAGRVAVAARVRSRRVSRRHWRHATTRVTSRRDGRSRRDGHRLAALCLVQ